MKKILVPVVMAAVGMIAFAGANVNACSHDHEDKVEYGNSSAYKRFCPRHGWWDIRFGATCPGCRAPQFGF